MSLLYLLPILLPYTQWSPVSDPENRPFRVANGRPYTPSSRKMLPQPKVAAWLVEATAPLA